jgi:hypothetical protein
VFPNFTRTGVRVTATPTDGVNPGFVEHIGLFAATGAQERPAVAAHLLATYRGGLEPRVVDRVFTVSTFNGNFLG